MCRTERSELTNSCPKIANYKQYTNLIRSSAVAERPRDASSLSVVSFNIPTARFLSRVSILTRDIDIANLSVRPSVRPSVVAVSDENGLTYRHSFSTIR